MALDGPGVVTSGGERTPDVTAYLCSDRGRRVAERDGGKGKLHRRRAYTPAGGAHGTGIACGGSGTAGAASIPSRWIAYRATSWNTGAAATPPYTVRGPSMLTAQTTRGRDRGRNPMNDATYLLM